MSDIEVGDAHAGEMTTNVGSAQRVRQRLRESGG